MLFNFDRARSGLSPSAPAPVTAPADAIADRPGPTASPDRPRALPAGSALAQLKALGPRLTPAQRTSIAMLERHAACRPARPERTAPGIDGVASADPGHGTLPRRPRLTVVAPARDDADVD